MSNRYKSPKVHLLGPVTGGGFRRTLCEHSLGALQTAPSPDKATCQICVWRASKQANIPC